MFRPLFLAIFREPAGYFDVCSVLTTNAADWFNGNELKQTEHIDKPTGSLKMSKN